MTIGVIYTAYNTESYVERSLRPWIEARAARLGGNRFLICAVSVPFEGFEQNGPPDQTGAMLATYRMKQDIDELIESDKPMKETEARGAALKWLKEQGVDMTLMCDSDEIWELSQIERAFAFVARNPLIPWFKVCYRNAAFDEHTYLVEPFMPPRIHRVRHSSYEAAGFWDDNNVQYRGRITRDIRRDDSFSHLTVPKSSVWVRHLSWISDDRSRRKSEYQVRRWGACSFRWDDQLGLQFDESYYRSKGLPLPETATDPA